MKGVYMMQKWMLFALFLSTAVRAEFFIDVLAGQAQVQDGSFTAAENREIEIPGGWLTSQGDLSGADSTGLGLRAGYWIGAKNLHWLGAAVDLGGFRADAQDADADVTVVAISQDDRADVNEYWREHDIPFTCIPDENETLKSMYYQQQPGLAPLPAVFVIDQQGILRLAHYADGMSDIPTAQVLLNAAR